MAYNYEEVSFKVKFQRANGKIIAEVKWNQGSLLRTQLGIG